MARLNTSASVAPVFTHEGGKAVQLTPYQQLRRSVLTCLLWEDTFYEKGSEIAARIAELIPKVPAEKVAALAVEARDRMHLRHAPLFLTRELARIKGAGPLVEQTLARVIQRADELPEFLALYWQEKRQPLSAAVKRGLASAFGKFDHYRLAKYNRDNAIKLRDVLFLVHAKPKDADQAALWKRLVDGTLESPDTWEVALSAGKDKKETFERLLSEGKLGGLAVLRNLRNMTEAGVSETLIRLRLADGIARALPFRFVTAARYAPHLEDAIEGAMLEAVEGLEKLPGKTGFLIDVSGSMDYRLGNQGESRTTFQVAHVAQKGETSRIDVAAALAILLRETAEQVAIATFSNQVAQVPARHGFALRDAIAQSQPHAGTLLRAALDTVRLHAKQIGWDGVERIIVITDEQSQDGIAPAWVDRAYVVNVAPYKNGVGYRNGWTHIDGWSERVIDYIREVEAEGASA